MKSCLMTRNAVYYACCNRTGAALHRLNDEDFNREFHLRKCFFDVAIWSPEDWDEIHCLFAGTWRL